MKLDNSQMNTKTIAAIVIPVATILFTSNVFSTELLVDFDAEKTYLEESIGDSNKSMSSIQIKNTGIIQAKNVLAQILFDSEIKISDSDCLEGKILINKDSVSIEFSRMSINVSCQLVFPANSNYNTTKITITSDGHSAVYPEYKIIKDSWTAIFITFAIILTVELVVIFYFARIIYDVTLELFSRNHTKIKCWKDIRDSVKKTHNVRINSHDASILCSIINGKHTISELNADTKITKLYLKRKVRRLQRNDIIYPDRYHVYDSIQKSIKDICK